MQKRLIMLVIGLGLAPLPILVIPLRGPIIWQAIAWHLTKLVIDFLGAVPLVIMYILRGLKPVYWPLVVFLVYKQVCVTWLLVIKSMEFRARSSF